MMRRLLALITGLLTSACCTSLPKLQEKRVAFPQLAPAFDRVEETTADWRDAKRNRDVPAKIYTPSGASGKLPVVVFSHGIGEDRESYAYLGRALAQHGFLAVHLTHAGTDRAVLQRGYRHLYRALKQKENWQNRPLDVSFALDQLASRNDADLERVAVAGHSAGAFTAFALAGMLLGEERASMRDPRVKAAIPMSMPRMEQVVPPGGYDTIAIPLLNMTGTCDTSILYRTFPRHRRIPFEQTRATQQYLVTFKGVNHDMFSALRDEHHDAIAAVTIAFLRARLLRDVQMGAWLDDVGVGDALKTRLAVERK